MAYIVCAIRVPPSLLFFSLTNPLKVTVLLSYVFWLSVSERSAAITITYIALPLFNSKGADLARFEPSCISFAVQPVIMAT